MILAPTIGGVRMASRRGGLLAELAVNVKRKPKLAQLGELAGMQLPMAHQAQIRQVWSRPTENNHG